MFGIAVFQRFRCQTQSGGVLVYFIDNVTSDAVVNADVEGEVLIRERVEQTTYTVGIDVATFCSSLWLR